MQFLQRVWPHHKTYGTFSTMLKDSQHIGHSSPSSLLTIEEASSSEHSQAAWVWLIESFFSPTLPAMQLDAKLHILVSKEQRP
jgi:hypothetical protein